MCTLDDLVGEGFVRDDWEPNNPAQSKRPMVKRIGHNHFDIFSFGITTSDCAKATLQEDIGVTSFEFEGCGVSVHSAFWHSDNVCPNGTGNIPSSIAKR